MRNLLFIMLAFQILPKTSHAQKSVSANLEAGLSLYSAWKNNSKAALLPSITLGPGLKFFKTKGFSAGLSLPCTAGWNLNKGTFFGVNLPLLISLKMGNASGNDKESKLGFIVGAGAGYTNIANYYEYSSEKRAHKEFWGYQVRAGITFPGKDDREQNISPGIMINLGKSITPGSGYLAGLSLLVIFN